MGQTLFDKVWNKHVLAGKEGDPQLLYIDLHLIHEVTSPQAFEDLRLQNRQLRRPDLTFATLDHNVPTVDIYNIKDEIANKQITTLQQNAKDFGVHIFDMGSDEQGIVHMVGPETGLTQPGKTIVCGDSHTATHGAFGAIAFGIGTSEVEHVFATQTLWQTKPKNLKINVTGQLPPGVYAKDIILHLINQHGVDFGTGYALEFAGETIEGLSMEARMTICNMAIEAGAKYGMMAPDETTFDYVKGRPYATNFDYTSMSGVNPIQMRMRSLIKRFILMSQTLNLKLLGVRVLRWASALIRLSLRLKVSMTNVLTTIWDCNRVRKQKILI